MDAHTRLFAPSGAATWSKLGGAIERLLRWLTSGWYAAWTPPLLEMEAAPTCYLETLVNGRGCAVPILRDALGRSQEIVAAAELASLGGGLEASLISTRMSAARVWLSGCAEEARAPERIAAVAGQLLQIGMEASPQRWMPLGCIPALEVHDYGGGGLGVTLYTECEDALGETAIEAAARAMAAPLASLAKCAAAPAIQSGHVQATRAQVRCRVHVQDLMRAVAREDIAGAPLRALPDEMLSWFGVDRHQPELAATHNAFVLEGVNAAATALGFEAWRFVAAAQSHAARWGSCEPLARWRRHGHELLGQLELPVDLESAQLAMPFAGDDRERREAARRRVQLVAGVGLFASLAFVRAVLAANVKQPASLERGQIGSRATPGPNATQERASRDATFAESGVRLIAPAHAASRSRTG